MQKKRIVVKVGTSTLTHKTGKTNIQKIGELVSVLADLHNMGHEVILVSSGAIGIGTARLGLHKKPQSIKGRQAAAAVGQGELMFLYDKFFGEYDVIVSQLLSHMMHLKIRKTRCTLQTHLINLSNTALFRL